MNIERPLSSDDVKSEAVYKEADKGGEHSPTSSVGSVPLNISVTGIEDDDDIGILETKIKQLLSLKYQFRGQRLFDEIDAFVAKELHRYSDDQFDKAEEMLWQKHRKVTRTAVCSRFIIYGTLKHSIIGFAGIPFEDAFCKDHSYVSDAYLNSDRYNYIDSPDFFDQKFLVYKKYKYPAVLEVQPKDLQQQLCIRHPYINLAIKLRERENMNRGDLALKIDITEFVSREMVTEYFKIPYAPSLGRTEIQRYFDAIQYLDYEYYLQVQDFKQDPLYSLKDTVDYTMYGASHDPYYCKSCVSTGFVRDLQSLDKGERARYIQEFGAYFPEQTFYQLTLEEYLKYVEGKNPLAIDFKFVNNDARRFC